MLPQKNLGFGSIVAVGEEAVTLLVGAVEEKDGPEPLGVTNKVAGGKFHVSLSGLGALGNHSDLAADDVHLLVHVPFPGEAAPPAGFPHRPSVDA